MTDIITSQNPFSPGNIPVRWKDLGDGTYGHGIAAHLFGWDSVNGVPVRVGASPAGVLSTTVGVGGGGGTGGISLQGARDVTAQAWLVDGSAVVQPISAVSLPLPAGAAADTTVAAVRDRLPAALVGARLDVNVGASVAVGRNWTITETVPVSGTFFQGTQPISAVSLPLPTGAAQDRTTAAGPSAVRLTDGASFYDARARTWTITETVPVSIASALDVVDRAARLLGHVTVDNASIAVTGTFWQGTQPVSGTFWQVTQPISAVSLPLPTGAAQEHTGAASFHSVQLTTGAAFYDSRQIRALTSADVISAVQSGTWTVAQGTPPWSENLTQLGGTALVAVAVPAGGFGQVTIPVRMGVSRKATYYITARNISSGALVANTAKAILSLEHAAISTKNARVTRVWITGVVSAAGAAAISDLSVQWTRGTAASSAGTAVTPGLANAAQGAADTVAKTLPTIVAATVISSDTLLVTAAAGLTAGMLIPRQIIYDSVETDFLEPMTMRSGVLESIVVNLLSSSTPTAQVTIEVEMTEE